MVFRGKLLTPAVKKVHQKSALKKFLAWFAPFAASTPRAFGSKTTESSTSKTRIVRIGLVIWSHALVFHRVDVVG
jgi:hypothetical protein